MKRIIIGQLFLTSIRPNLACLTFMLSVAVVAISGCRRPAPTIAVIPRTCGTWLWEAEHTGVERAAPAYGLSVYWNAPMRDDDVQGQIEILTHARDRGVKGIIVSPVEALPLRTPVYRALETGTPVVVVGTDLGLAPGKKLAYVLNDERSGGQMAARRLGSILHDHGSIAILGINKQLTSTAERARNLEITLAKEFPQIHVVYRSLALPTVSQEQQVAEKLLVEGADLMDELQRCVLAPGQVLDKAHDEAIVLRGLDDDRGDLFLAESDERLQTALAADEIVAGPVSFQTDCDRLLQTEMGDAGHQLGEDALVADARV